MKNNTNLFSFRKLLALLVIPLALSLCSCGDKPVDRLSWAPNGEIGSLEASDGLRLINDKGELSDVVLEGTAAIAWAPDSKTLVAATKEDIKDWGRLKPFVSEDEIKKIEKSASFLIKHGKELNASSSEFSISEDEKKELIEGIRPGDLLTYIYSVDPALLKTIMKSTEIKPDTWNSFVYSVRSYQIEKNRLKPGPLLHKTREEVEAMAVSPDGKILALVLADTWSKQLSSLLLVSKDGKTKELIEDDVQEGIAWCPKHSILAYESGNLVYILKVEGNIQKDLKGEPIALTGLSLRRASPIYKSRLKWSQDCRLYFTSPAQTLPASIGETSSNHSLYMMEPHRHLGITKMIDSSNECCDYFDISPSGDRAIVMSGKGKIALIDFPRGNMSSIQSKEFTEEQYSKSALLPKFKNEDEISYCAPLEAKEKGARGAEIILHSINSGKDKVLSKTWIDSAVEFLKLAPQKDKDKDKDKESLNDREQKNDTESLKPTS